MTIVIATGNAHKVAEIEAILGGKFCYISLADITGAPKAIEDAPTFAGNATKKAVELANWLRGQAASDWAGGSDTLVLADDSGLEVDALNGAPGVHSARFAAVDSGAAGNASDAANREKLLRLMRDTPIEKRTARFRCALALTPLPGTEQETESPVCYADEAELSTQLFDGTCEGRIGLESRGDGGFGYDPLFIPAGHNETFAEIGEDIKNRLSHRAKALEKLRRWLKDRQL
jgi:XTP/dITP diphosphohydrolase